MGRIGRLALRAAFGAAERQADDPYAGNRLQVVHLNELKGGAATTAHLLAFDTVQGKWRTPIAAEGEDRVRIGDKTLSFSSHATPAEIPWGELWGNGVRSKFRLCGRRCGSGKRAVAGRWRAVPPTGS